MVEVLDHFDDSGKYLVMELVEGVDLGAVLKKRGNPGLSLAEAVEYTRQACEALQYVHEQQIVHRDVKPQNLILSDDGIVLVDFGVAREIERGGRRARSASARRASWRRRCSPAARVSPRSDVFGLAATLWTLLTGKPPVYADPTKLTEVCPEVSPALEQTIRAGLEMIPERRVASVTRLRQGARRAARARDAGESLALSVERRDAPRSLMEAIVRTAAGVFEAAACSIALTDATTGELVYQSAWGAGAREIVGVRLPPGNGHLRRGGRDRRGRGRPRLPQRPALRRADRRGHRLRAAHDARRAAQARRQRDRRRCRSSTAATAASTARGRGARRAVRRAGGHGARRRATASRASAKPSDGRRDRA